MQVRRSLAIAAVAAFALLACVGGSAQATLPLDLTGLIRPTPRRGRRTPITSQSLMRV